MGRARGGATLHMWMHMDLGHNLGSCGRGSKAPRAMLPRDYCARSEDTGQCVLMRPQSRLLARVPRPKPFACITNQWSQTAAHPGAEPVHVPVTLAQEMQNGRLVPLDEDRMTPELVAACVKACASKDIELLETPVVMTARGSGLELIEDESLRMLEYSDDDGDDDDDSEEALVLAELKHDKLSVLVLQTLEPLYVVGKLLEEDTFEVPTDEELDAVQDTIEQLVVEFEEGFDDEDDDLLDGIEDDEDYRP